MAMKEVQMGAAMGTGCITIDVSVVAAGVDAAFSVGAVPFTCATLTALFASGVTRSLFVSWVQPFATVIALAVFAVWTTELNPSTFGVSEESPAVRAAAVADEKVLESDASGWLAVCWSSPETSYASMASVAVAPTSVQV